MSKKITNALTILLVLVCSTIGALILWTMMFIISVIGG